MDRIDTAAKNQNTRIPIMLREDQKQFLASEGYVVEEYAISWAEPAPEREQPREEEPDLHWRDFILDRINVSAGCGYTEYWNRGLLTSGQQMFLEQRGYKVSFRSTPEIGTMISWDSNTTSA